MGISGVCTMLASRPLVCINWCVVCGKKVHKSRFVHNRPTGCWCVHGVMLSFAHRRRVFMHNLPTCLCIELLADFDNMLPKARVVVHFALYFFD